MSAKKKPLWSRALRILLPILIGGGLAWWVLGNTRVTYGPYVLIATLCVPAALITLLQIQAGLQTGHMAIGGRYLSRNDQPKVFWSWFTGFCLVLIALSLLIFWACSRIYTALS